MQPNEALAQKRQTKRETTGSSGTPRTKHASGTFHLFEFLTIMKLRKHLFMLIVLASLLITLVGHFLYLPVFPAISIITLTNPQDTPDKESILAEYGSKRANQNQAIDDYLHYLSSDLFYTSLAENVKYDDNYLFLNFTQAKDVSLFKCLFWRMLYERYSLKRPKQPPSEPAMPAAMPAAMNDTAEYKIEDIAASLKGMIEFSWDYSTGISIKVTSYDSQTSMIIANLAAKNFQALTTNHDIEELNETQNFIRDRLAETTTRLKEKELDLVNFKKKHNILGSGSRTSIFSEEFKRTESQIEYTRLSLQQNLTLVRHSQKLLTDMEKNVAKAEIDAKASNLNETQLRQRLSELTRQKNILLIQGHRDSDWRIKKVDDQINLVAEALSKLSAKSHDSVLKRDRQDDSTASTKGDPTIVKQRIVELQNENTSLDEKIKSLEAMKDKLSEKLQSVPQTERDLQKLTRSAELEFELYSYLRKKQSQLDIQQISAKNIVKVWASDIPPSASPRIYFYKKLLLSLLVGSFLSAVTSLFLECLNPTIKRKEDLEEIHIGLLGELPRLAYDPTAELKKGSDLNTSLAHLMVCKNAPESAESMAFKYLRTRILQLKGENSKPLQSITITSPGNGDGKSFVAANLAVSFARSGKKTILVDADLRKPSLSRYFNYQTNEGLSSLLTLKSFLNEVILKDQARRLDILPAGYTDHDPTELIGGEKFELLIRYLKLHYEIIVIDTPPATSLIDASIVGSLTDCIIMVANCRKTRKDSALAAHKRVQQIAHKSLYGILNNVDKLEGALSQYAYPYIMIKPEGMREHASEREAKALKLFQENLKRKTTAPGTGTDG